jgi:hypothetical protein
MQVGNIYGLWLDMLTEIPAISEIYYLYSLQQLPNAYQYLAPRSVSMQRLGPGGSIRLADEQSPQLPILVGFLHPSICPGDWRRGWLEVSTYD